MVAGLGFSNKLGTNALGLDIHFEPTIGIAAGRIDKAALGIRSFSEPLKRSVKQVMIPSIAKNFDVGGRPAWKPLSEGTLEVRRRWGLPHDAILLWSHDLKRVATQQNIWTISQDSAIIKDLPQKVWYGKVHQGGMGRHEGTGGRTGIPQPRASGKREVAAIPARPFLMIQVEDKEAIHDVFVKWVDEKLALASFGRL